MGVQSALMAHKEGQPIRMKEKLYAQPKLLIEHIRTNWDQMVTEQDDSDQATSLKEHVLSFWHDQLSVDFQFPWGDPRLDASLRIGRDCIRTLHISAASPPPPPPLPMCSWCKEHMLLYSSLLSRLTACSKTCSLTCSTPCSKTKKDGLMAAVSRKVALISEVSSTLEVVWASGHLGQPAGI